MLQDPSIKGELDVNGDFFNRKNHPIVKRSIASFYCQSIRAQTDTQRHLA